MALAAGNGAFRILGGVLIGLGAATSAGTSSVELGLLQKKIKEAEKIIKEDREYSEKLWNWISDVSYIQDALDTIRNIVDVNLLKVANDFHTCYKKISSSADLKSIDLKSIDLRALKFLKASPEVMNEISDVVGILLASSMLYDRYRPLFNLVFEAYKCDKVLSTACDVIVATAKITSAVNASKNSELTALQKSKIATGIALDAINILLASEGINSTSKEAKQIVKAAEKLKEEAEIFKKLYDGMK